MRTRMVISGLALATALGLAACDGSVKWPGFETPEPDPVSTTPETPDTTTPQTGVDPDTQITPPAPDPTPPVSEPEAPNEPDIAPPATDSIDENTPTSDAGETVETPEGPGEAGDENTPGEETQEDLAETVDETADGNTTTPPESETEPDPDGAALEDVALTPVEPIMPEPVTPEPQPDPEPEPVAEPAFSFHAPGDLLPGSGTGSPDRTVYAPDMVFPILNARAFPQSMVWNLGGGIGGGDECDARNYEYPWRDNFCEKRSRRNGTPSCPVERVHLGQDIRVGDAAGCNAMRREYRNNARGIARYRVVAAEDGVISNIGRYTVTLRSGPRIYRYLHMNMRALQVSLGDTISAGQHLGYVSKDFGGTPTTFHLHFEIKVNTPDGGWEFVPPYTSLVESYARREQAPGREIPRVVGVASSGPPIPDGVEITEGFVAGAPGSAGN